MAEEKKKLSLEEAFEKLETVIETLERPETSLEESFQAYNCLLYTSDAADD